MADDTITQLAGEVAVAPWTGANGEKYFGVVCGLANDVLVEAASKAMQSALIYDVTPRLEDFEQPAEAIDLLGRDAMLLRYPGENPYTSLRPRLRAKWTFWQSGIKAAMLAELAAAGYPGVQILVPNNYTPRPPPADYWSRFWAFFPAGTHPVTSPNGFILANAGVAQVGRDRIGPTGINTAAGSVYYEQLKDVLSRMKPAQWIVWDIIFEITAGVSYVHLQFRPRFADAHYSYTSAGAALPLGV